MRPAARLQRFGWLFFFVVDLVLSRVAYPDDIWGWSIYSAATVAAMGAAIAQALVFAYQRRRLSPWWLGAGALAASAIWYSATFALDLAVRYPYRSPFVEGLFGRGMVCLFMMVAWHGVFAALQSAARAHAAEKHASEARLLALRYQLNPHFLFNALNSAIALIDEAPARAQHMLTLLSQLLRDTLGSDASAEIPLASELRMIERYVEIEKVRFEDDLDVHFDVSAEAERCAIPPLLLHTLVENAVKHGFRHATARPLVVRVGARVEDDHLLLRVDNSGRLDKGSGGVGLANLEARLEASYPGAHQFSLREEEGEVHAKIEIRQPRSAA